MADLLATISSKTSAILKLAKTFGNAELYEKISDLKIQLAKLKTKHAALINENRKLKTELIESKNNPLNYDSAVYRDGKNAAFCPACYDSHHKRIHLKPTLISFIGEELSCPVCKNEFADAGKNRRRGRPTKAKPDK